MDERAVIDRIVDGVHAVLLVGESERERVVPVGHLPRGATPGTWLTVRFDGDELVHAVVEDEETASARRRIQDKLERLRRRGRGRGGLGPP